MAGRDRLTQLQDCLDDLLTQMYASLNYIHDKHPYGDIPSQPSQAPKPDDNTNNDDKSGGANNDAALAAARTAAVPGEPNAPPDAPSTPIPEQRDVFDLALRELAQDLVLKEQQIEFLINSLPGIGDSEADQLRRMQELDVELRTVEAERTRKEAEREEMVDVLASLIGQVKRIP